MSARVLIVDDSLTVRMDLAEAFEGTEVVPELAASLTDARAVLAAGPLPEVVVLDMLLPDGDGVELLTELRARPGGDAVVALMLSTEVEVADRIRGLKMGADEYVGKPYDRGYVVAKARALLRERRAESMPEDTVLVIDDSTTYREALKDALSAAGHTVVAAASGEEGLVQAAIHRPTAIVVDGIMPGIDGATFIRRVRLDPALRDTRCLLLTASEDRGAELAALEAGADTFVHKTAELAVVLAKLGAMLRGTTSQRVGPRGATQSLMGPKKILAVDDSATYLNEVADTLRGEGYDVVLAKCGEDALALLTVIKVDCVLLDLIMPGIGGTETCRRIKASPPLRDVPLILVTAVEDHAVMLEGLAAGADDYIAKSSELEVLKARVRAQIRRKQFEDENRRIREELLQKQLEATEARAALELAETRAALVGELELKNRELEAFSYTVSHDLRAPVRSIEGFGKLLLEEHAGQLDEVGLDHLRRVLGATRRMDELIEGLLELSRIGRSPLTRTRVSLTDLSRAVIGELARRAPERQVQVDVDEDLVVHADPRLMRALLDNLLGNAWKFTAKAAAARIEVRRSTLAGQPSVVVRDNGAGFDMRRVDKLFRPFQRLHAQADFPGTGVGLATVRRIVERHGGSIRADSAVGQGAIFEMTLGNDA